MLFGIFSTRCVRMGLPASGRRGFGRDSVRGQRRVANPPARMKAFIEVSFSRVLPQKPIPPIILGANDRHWHSF